MLCPVNRRQLGKSSLTSPSGVACPNDLRGGVHKRFETGLGMFEFLCPFRDARLEFVFRLFEFGQR